MIPTNRRNASGTIVRAEAAAWARIPTSGGVTIDTAPFLHVFPASGKLAFEGSQNNSFGYILPPSQNAQRADGVYVKWNWDGDTLVVENDAVGLFPLYYYVDDSQICISPYIELLLQRNFYLHLDMAALAVFLRTGNFLGADTPYREIKALSPNAKLSWKPGKLNIESSIFIAEPLEITRSEAFDEYSRLFADSIQQTFFQDARSVLPLSGGRDSRHILAELCRQDRKPHTVITVNYAKEDTLVAQKLAKFYGIEHAVIEPDGEIIDGQLQKNALTNYSALEHGWMVSMGEFMNDPNSVSYDGLGGDVLSAGLFLTTKRHALYRSGDIGQLALDLMDAKPRLRQMLNRILSHNFMAQLSESTGAKHLHEELLRFESAPNPIGSFHIHNRTRRTVAMAPLGLQRSVHTIFFPYFHNDLYQFLSRLPGEHFTDHTFHTDAIRKIYPEIGHIDFAPKNNTSTSSRLARSFRYRRTAWQLRKLLMEYSTNANLLFSKNLSSMNTRTLLLGDSSVFTTGLVVCYLLQIARHAQVDFGG